MRLSPLARPEGFEVPVTCMKKGLLYLLSNLFYLLFFR